MAWVVAWGLSDHKASSVYYGATHRKGLLTSALPEQDDPYSIRLTPGNWGAGDHLLLSLLGCLEAWGTPKQLWILLGRTEQSCMLSRSPPVLTTANRKQKLIFNFCVEPNWWSLKHISLHKWHFLLQHYKLSIGRHNPWTPCWWCQSTSMLSPSWHKPFIFIHLISLLLLVRIQYKTANQFVVSKLSSQLCPSFSSPTPTCLQFSCQSLGFLTLKHPCLISFGQYYFFSSLI